MNLGGFQNYLNELSKKFEKMPHTMLSKIGGEVLNSATITTFRNQGKRSGSAIVAIPDGTNETLVNNVWKSFSETTLKINPRRRGGKLLQDTGILRMSINYSFKDDNIIEYGSRYKLAPIHQFGANIKMFGKHKAKIPSRPFVYITDTDLEKIDKVVKIAIDEVL